MELENRVRRGISRRPLWWMVFVILAVACAVFAARQFSEAFPIVGLDLRMDRASALQSARALASARDWGPRGKYRQAASFGVDDTVRTFVELEGGGKAALRAMLDRGDYAAYAWTVRHFREADARETEIRFTPEGRPYGFHETLPESAAGASLAEDQARAIAEAEFARWDVDRDPYAAVSASREQRPSGRIDHTFLYERRDARAGEGRYRLKIVVGGDRVTAFTHFLQVPEGFTRRYESMRAANTGIAFGAQTVMLVLYLLGACVVGLFVLLRERRVLWRQPLAWGLAIGGLSALAQVNAWPLAWMQYDTALPVATFMLQLVGAAVGMLLLNGGLLTLSFMAAESLTRSAFGHHPQLWRLWSRDAAGTVQMLGRTAGGYLLTGIEFAFIVALYLITSRLLGWWVPSETLVQPDVLATHLPWLAAVGTSIQAGFWEECLFRAVPLAAAARIGSRFGARRAWIIGALVLQALVFGGAHANYPSEPAYSRLVELFLPSLTWGLVYLAFGLLPVVLTHYLFDLLLLSLPLFTSRAPGIWADQAMVVAFALAPLAIAAIARLRRPAAVELSETLYNRAWQPPEQVADAPEQALETQPAGPPLSVGAVRAAWIAGFAGLALWASSAPLHNDAPPIRIDRGQAVERAHDALRASGFDPKPPWRTLPTVQSAESDEATFVWRSAGRDAMRTLIGTYLRPPGWDVRVAMFEGDIAERAEEWTVELDGDGALRRIRHQLPEGRAGDSLEATAARDLAHDALRARLGAEPARLREISAVATQHPARRDWTFVFADTAAHALGEGERRLSVELAGAEIVDATRLVHVPEGWMRDFRATESTLQIFRFSRMTFAILVTLGGAIVGIILWSRRRFPARVTLATFGLAFGTLVAIAFNQAPLIQARFSTAQSWGLQQTLVGISLLLLQLVLAGCAALLGGLGVAGGSGAARTRAPATLGIAAGLIAAGVIGAQRWLATDSAPWWPSIQAAHTHVPFLADALSPSWLVFIRGGVILACLMVAQRWSQGWTRHRLLVATLLVLVGAAFGQFGPSPNLPMWALQGLLAGLGLLALHAFLLRHDLSLVPGMVATLVVLGLVRVAIEAGHPTARPGALAGMAIAAAVAWAWTRALRRGMASDAGVPPMPGIATRPVAEAPEGS